MTDEEYTEAARPLVKRWRKKPVVVEAVRWDGSDLAIEALNGVLGIDPLELTDGAKRVRIPMPDGEMFAGVGDYIVKDADGGFYACAPGAFEKFYVRCDGGEGK